MFDQKDIDRLAKAALGDPRQIASSSEYPKLEIARQYVPEENLVNDRLSTKMRALHSWYKKHAKDGTISFMVGVKEEHYCEEYVVSVEFRELFWLYNVRVLDKSIISSYCL